MKKFELHQKLSADCITLGELPNALLLLMNNSLVPWFVIVPKTLKLEIYQLTNNEQFELYANINALSEFVLKNFDVDKLNVASIGNVVKQMHIHVIGRHEGDYCWPNVVWGRSECVQYTKEEIQSVVAQLDVNMKNCFKSIQVE